MTDLSAQTIRYYCRNAIGTKPIIFPFVERGIAEGLSYGLSSASYDCRIAQTIWLWPFWGRLASTVETFCLPNHIHARVSDKSSNARRFILVQNTLIDAGFCGGLTLELTRFRPWPVRIKKGTPICQIVFTFLDEPTKLPYAGKYQGQSGNPTPAIYEQKNFERGLA